MRAYWPLENVNDSSGNARNLTNVATTFIRARFGNGSNFDDGSNGDGLDLAANPLSALTVPNMTISFWMKLNNAVASHSGFSNIFSMNTHPQGFSDGQYNNFSYTITAGDITYRLSHFLSTTNALVEPTLTADLLWHSFTIVKSGTTTISLYRDGILLGTDTGEGTDVSLVDEQPDTVAFTIGNSRIVTKDNAAWAVFDEFWIEERALTHDEIRKNYSQARGFQVAA